MGISDADTAKNPRYFRFVCKKTAHFANACIIEIWRHSPVLWTAVACRRFYASSLAWTR